MECKEKEELSQTCNNQTEASESEPKHSKDDIDTVTGDSTELQPDDGVSQDQEKTDHSLSGLTKHQLRKLKKRQMWEKKKEQRVEARREKRQERKRKKQAEKGDESQQSIFVPRKKKKRMSDPDASDVQIVIDCGFDDLMKEPDVTKLSKQIQRSYASNRTSDKPFQFYICNFKDQTKARFDKAISEYPKWDVHFREQGLNELFDKDSIVYLTADSPQVLTVLDPGKVYVVGGLVDHNHHKGICYNRAVEQGWGHAQLPIGEYMKFSARKVLTVNHVFEILVAFIETDDWKEAFDRVIPQRKFHTISRRERRRKAHLKDGERDSGSTENAERDCGNEDDSDGDDGETFDVQEGMMHGGSKGEGSSSEEVEDDSRTKIRDSSNAEETKEYHECSQGDLQKGSKVEENESNRNQKGETEEGTTLPNLTTDKL